MKERKSYGPVKVILNITKCHPITTIFSVATLSIGCNFITSHHVYIPFAHATLIERKMYPVSTPCPEMKHELRILAKNGWPIHRVGVHRLSTDRPERSWDHFSTESDMVSRKRRHLGDDQCCRLPLEVAGLAMPSPAKRFDLFEFYVNYQKLVGYICIEAHDIDHPLLRHTYMSYFHPMATGQEKDGTLTSIVGKTLNLLLPYELLRFKGSEGLNGIIEHAEDDGVDEDAADFRIEEAPNAIGDIVDELTVRNEWKPPQGWHYVDDELPRTFEKEQMNRKEDEAKIRKWYKDTGLPNDHNYPSDDED